MEIHTYKHINITSKVINAGIRYHVHIYIGKITLLSVWWSLNKQNFRDARLM